MNGLCETQLLFEVNCFLDVEEILKLSSTSKSLHAICFKEVFWKRLVVERIAPKLAPLCNPTEWTSALLSEFRTVSYFDVFAAFHSCTANPFTYYADVLNMSSRARFGALISLELVEGLPHLLIVDPIGSALLIYKFEWNSVTKCFESFPGGRLVFQEGGVHLLHPQTNQVVIELRTLPMNRNYTEHQFQEKQEEISSDILGVLGLVCGEYGGHGTEILHVG